MLQISLLGDQRFTLDGEPLNGSLARRSGEIIALTVRNTYDIRYPAANAA